MTVMKKHLIPTAALFLAGVLIFHPDSSISQRPSISLHKYVSLDHSLGRPMQDSSANQLPPSRSLDLPAFNAGEFTSFEAAISAVGIREAVLFISNQQSLQTSVTVPSNVHLRFQTGALLVITPGATATINGPLEAGLFQIFAGTGLVNFKGGIIKEVYPQWWGAKGDGITNDTRAVQQSINAIARGNIADVVFVKGTYLVDTIVLDSNVNIVGQGWNSIIKHNKYGYRFCLSINPNREGTPNPVDNKHDITIRDIQLRGTVDTDGFSEGTHLLNINAATQVVISKCKFVGWRGDAIYLGSSNVAKTERHNQNIVISECVFNGLNNDNRNAISIIDGDNISINKCSFANCTRRNMPGAIDLEPDRENSFAILRNITISNNSFKRIGGFGGVISVVLLLGQEDFRTPPENIVIKNNTIDQLGNISLADGIFLFQIQNVNDATPQNKITISDNTIRNTRRPFKMSGMKGVLVKNNTFELSTHAGLVASAMPISSKAKEKCQHLTFVDNTFAELGSMDGVGIAVLNDVDYLDFIGNTFRNIGLPNGKFGKAISFLMGTTNWVRIENNHFSGIRTLEAASMEPQAQTYPPHNRIGNNTFADGQKMRLPLGHAN